MQTFQVHSTFMSETGTYQISSAASIKHATSCSGAADSHAAGPIPQSRSNQKLPIMLYNAQDNARAGYKQSI